jgi:hypothetical protein
MTNKSPAASAKLWDDQASKQACFMKPSQGQYFQQADIQHINERHDAIHVGST